MRKVYTKPYLIVESFQLDAAIAAGCNSSNKKSPLNHGLYDCVAADGDIFGDESPCLTDVVDNDSSPYNTLCYHGPTGELQVSNYYLES